MWTAFRGIFGRFFRRPQPRIAPLSLYKYYIFVRRLSWCALALIAVTLTRSGSGSAPLTNDAYIWQRQWTPALERAIGQSADIVHGWRVLAGETDRSGRLKPVQADLAVLQKTGRPVTLVIRIDGQLAGWDRDALLADLGVILDRWSAGPAAITGVEIDYDCATSKLPLYADFLAKVRSLIGPSTSLSITALPTWFTSPNLAAVLKATDQAVLQVHAVQNPHDGLFDADLAYRWIGEMAARDRKPFAVALPAYGVRVDWRADGKILAVEGETPRLTGNGDSTELTVSPSEISALLQRLADHPAPGLRGIVWFRLPTGEDSRAWSLAAWRSVVTGQAQTGNVALISQADDTAGLRRLVLVNRGNTDAELPDKLAVPQDCPAADGINGYRLDYTTTGQVLRRVQKGLLKAGYSQEIGWVRCEVTRPR
jgi:hypothetical protein